MTSYRLHNDGSVFGRDGISSIFSATVPRPVVDPTQTRIQQVSSVLFVEAKQSENEAGRSPPSSTIICEPLFL
jgi:hypothetical protein